MYLRQVSGRGHRTQEPFGSTSYALPLGFPQSTRDKLFFYYMSICIIDTGASRHRTRNARF